MIEPLKNTVRQFFPDRLLTFLNHTPDKNFQRVSYSVHGEDLLLENLLRHQVQGFYVDVGAHHPFRFSNTYLLYKKGWHGINIDPLPGGMKIFQEHRMRDINLELAVSDEEQSLAYYMFENPAFNSMSYEEVKTREKPIMGEVSIETTTLESILDTYLDDRQPIDLLNIDVEGHDIHVIDSNNWEKYRPKYVLVEDLSFSYEKLSNSLLYNKMTDLGYELIANVIKTLFFKDVRN